MRSQRVAFLIVVLSVLLLPAAAWAQSGITGVVRDTSGGVLPGVTVEATSPALIEGARSAVTDGQGVYTITDVRPGTYTVTFTLAGFRTFVRDGIVLPAQFTATVNADMAVGALEESITVSGEAPVVDIRSTRAQTQYTNETLSSLPGSGRITTMINALPGATLTSEGDRAGGGLSDRAQTRFSMHGAPSAAPVVDGMNNELAAANTGVVVYNQLALQEVVAETSGVGADRDSGGVQLNMVPREGGNSFTGQAVYAFTGPDLESNNLNDDIRARGLDKAGAASMKKYYDTGFGLGGPIQRDRLWFYGAARRSVTQQYAAGIYWNRFEQPQSLLYEADLDRPASSNDFYRDYSLRLTAQLTQKNKLSIAGSSQRNCNCVYSLFRPQGGTTLTTPEASTEHEYEPNYNAFVTWTYPATNRVLVTAAGGMNQVTQTNRRGPDVVTNESYQITEQSLDLRYGASYGPTAGGSSYSTIVRRQFHQQTSVAYVTGSHNFKSGVNFRKFVTGDHEKYGRDLYMANLAVAYTFNNQRPTQLTLMATPQHFEETGLDMSFYAQDQWTIDKLTLNLGARYNDIDVSSPDQVLPAGFYVPERQLAAKEHIPHWRNFYPRLGAAYDVFGTGRTAIKGSWGGYADVVRAATANPAGDMTLSTNRSWNDSLFGAGDPRSGNFRPDCDQFIMAANGECGAGSSNFGKSTVGTTRETDALEGFNKQFNNWQASVSLQHEITSGMAFNVGYFRTWYNGFLVTDNALAGPGDFDAFCFTAPTDTRLGVNSGARICDLYDIDPALQSTIGTNNVVSQGTKYGKQTQVYNGVDFTLNSRFLEGGQFSGGVSIGRTVTDNCYQNSDPSLSAQGATAGAARNETFCNVSPTWGSGTQFKFLAVYPLPYDIQTSLIFQNVPGVGITASYNIPNAVVRESLGRNLAACPSQTAATCNSTYATQLIPSNSMYEPRLSQFDLRFSKVFGLGASRRLRGSLDILNVFNAAAVLSMTTAYGTDGSSWQNVGQLLSGRLIKIGVNYDF